MQTYYNAVILMYLIEAVLGNYNITYEVSINSVREV